MVRFDGDWSPFYEATKDRSHWPLVEQAAALFSRPGHALDLGCGAGRDTRFLLSKGWHVTAVDREAEALGFLAQLAGERLELIESDIEGFTFGESRFDLISAQFALPFVPSASFPQAWDRLQAGIRRRGVFTGQFFGERDEWNTGAPDMNFHTRREAEELLAQLQVLHFEEVEQDGTVASGAPKHWHVFHIMARRP